MSTLHHCWCPRLLFSILLSWGSSTLKSVIKYALNLIIMIDMRISSWDLGTKSMKRWWFVMSRQRGRRCGKTSTRSCSSNVVFYVCWILQRFRLFFCQPVAADKEVWPWLQQQGPSFERRKRRFKYIGDIPHLDSNNIWPRKNLDSAAVAATADSLFWGVSCGCCCCISCQIRSRSLELWLWQLGHSDWIGYFEREN